MVFKNKNRLKISTKTRSNFFGSLKFLKLKISQGSKWKRIHKSNRKPVRLVSENLIAQRLQSKRIFKKKLSVIRNKVKRTYKRTLFTKQNFKAFYGNISEHAFKQIVKACGNNFNLVVESLETRLDVVVFRMGFVDSIFAANQLINHGHVLVNGETQKSYNLKVNPKDIISIKLSCKPLIFTKLVYKLYLSYNYNIVLLFTRMLFNKFKITHRGSLQDDSSLTAEFNKYTLNRLKFNSSKHNVFYKYKNKRALNVLNLTHYKLKHLLPTTMCKRTLYLYLFFITEHLLPIKKQFRAQSVTTLNLLYLICTPKNVLVNYNVLIGIFLYNLSYNEMPFNTYMNIATVQRYYHRKYQF